MTIGFLLFLSLQRIGTLISSFLFVEEMEHFEESLLTMLCEGEAKFFPTLGLYSSCNVD